MTRPVLRIPLRIRTISEKKSEEILITREEIEEAKKIVGEWIYQILKDADLVFSILPVSYIGQMISFEWKAQEWNKNQPIVYGMVIKTNVRRMAQTGIVTPEQHKSWVEDPPSSAATLQITLPFHLRIIQGGLEALTAHDIRSLDENSFRAILSEQSSFLTSSSTKG
jgi:hypothetical protein